MFKIEMLPANEGDALWIEYGSDPVRRILIDCGRKTAYRAVADRLDDARKLKFELFVLTHVDADHIAGAVPLLQDTRFGPDRVKDVWFNGWRHLNDLHRDDDGDIPILGAKQGEFFGAVLRDRAYPWNEKFSGFGVVVEDQGELPRVELEGGMVLTLLGPTKDKLGEMRERWIADLRSADPEKRIDPGDWERALDVLGRDSRHGPDVLSGGHEGPIVVEDLAEVPFEADGSEPNGSSISFLAEFDGKAVLFAGDAHAPQLAGSVRRLIEARGLETLPLDAFKMAHHGSARNNSYELLELLSCSRYLLSSNGSQHHHPDPETLARALTLYEDSIASSSVASAVKLKFFFNYKSDETLPWSDQTLRAKHSYEAIYPESDAGLSVSL